MKTLLTNWRSYLIAFFVSLGVCLGCFVFGYSNGNQSGQAEIQAKWDKERLKTAQNALIYQVKVSALENQNYALLSQKQKELEHEKQLSKDAAYAASNQLDSLWNRVNTLNGKLSQTSNSTSGTQTALAQSRELLGTCAKRYTEMGREADELRDRAALGKVYAETVEQFRDDVIELENVKEVLF